MNQSLKAECDKKQLSLDGEESIIIHDKPLEGTKAITPIVREASQLNQLRGVGAIAFDWAVIICCFAAAIYLPNVAVWIAAAVIISGRQHALLVLMHEATHFRIVNHRGWNERLSDWFLAWPLLVNTDGFRRDHLPHHFHIFTERDPEYTRKRVRPEFQFPQTRAHFLWLIVKDVLGLSVLKMAKMLANFSGAEATPAKDRGPYKKWFGRLERTTYYAVLGAAIWYFNLILPVLLLWFLPAFTLLFAILRIRNVAEHSGVGMDDDLDMSRNILRPMLWERALFGPHHVGLHLVHHLYPSVPFYHLPMVHNALMGVPEYAERSRHVETYFGLKGPSVLTQVTTQSTAAVPKSSAIDKSEKLKVAS